jgi:hypothetical protein
MVNINDKCRELDKLSQQFEDGFMSISVWGETWDAYKKEIETEITRRLISRGLSKEWAESLIKVFYEADNAFLLDECSYLYSADFSALTSNGVSCAWDYLQNLFWQLKIDISDRAFC